MMCASENVVHRINTFIASSLAFGCHVGCHTGIFVIGLLFISTAVGNTTDATTARTPLPRMFSGYLFLLCKLQISSRRAWIFSRLLLRIISTPQLISDSTYPLHAAFSVRRDLRELQRHATLRIVTTNLDALELNSPDCGGPRICFPNYKSGIIRISC